MRRSYCATIRLCRATNPGDAVSIVVLIAMSLLFHVLRQYMRERIELKAQLERFSVLSAKCYSPDDRDIIHETIRRWYGSLEAFDNEVRNIILVRQCSPQHICIYKYI